MNMLVPCLSVFMSMVHISMQASPHWANPVLQEGYGNYYIYRQCILVKKKKKKKKSNRVAVRDAEM